MTYADDAAVERGTDAILASGTAVFQIHRLAPTDREHVAALLAHFNPPPGALVIDAGCGVGEVARLMAEARPDLKWLLVNISAAQLRRCPPGFDTRQCRMEAMPVAAQSVDAMMVCYAIGHVDLNAALTEAARVLRSGGVFFVYDIVAPDAAALRETLDYDPPSLGRLLATAKGAGFRLDRALHAPETVTMAEFMRVNPTEAQLRALADARPVIARFIRC